MLAVALLLLLLLLLEIVLFHFLKLLLEIFAFALKLNVKKFRLCSTDSFFDKTLLKIFHAVHLIW